MHTPLFSFKQSRRNTLIRLSATLAVFYAGGIFAPLSHAAQVAIPLYTLTYEVSLRGTSLGEMVISTTLDNGRVTVSGETFPSGIANLFGEGKFKEIIEYQQTENGLELVQITKLKGKNLQDRRTATVSASRQTIHLSEGDKTLDVRAGEQLDADTFPLLSIINADSAAPGRVEWVVSDKRVRSYVYEAPAAEVVSVKAGQFDTWRIRKRQKDNHDKTVTVWVTQSAPRFPVVIEVSKKGKTNTRLSLIRKETHS